jgi:LysR family glycine cleavage system transcriptional activator
MNRYAPRLPPLNALRAFEVSARHLNFRVAAEELGVTQGAIAQQVRGLEADLGIKLFDRLPRTLALTHHGRLYASQLRRAFELLAEATAALRPEPLRLTISVTPTFAAKWLMPRFPAFTEAHPDIELRIVATDALSNFQSDGVDIAVRQGRPPFGSGLVADLLFEQAVIAVCSPELLGERRRMLTADNLGLFTLLGDAHDLWPEFIERALGLTSVPATRRASFNQTSLAIDAAIAGQGLALANRFLVEQDLTAHRLAQAFEPTMRGSLGFYLVTPRRHRHPKQCEIVRQWLLSAARDQKQVL